MPRLSLNSGIDTVDPLIVFLMVLLLGAIIIVLPWVLNIYYGHRIKFKIINEMHGESNFFKDFEKGERKLIVDNLLASLPERKGMSRFSMMLGVIFIVAAAIFYILINGGTPGFVLSDQSANLLQNTLGVLTGAFAAIIGFYFGGRAEGVTTDKLKDLGEKMKGGGETPQRIVSQSTQPAITTAGVEATDRST
jgi:hypothetical protein